MSYEINLVGVFFRDWQRGIRRWYRIFYDTISKCIQWSSKHKSTLGNLYVLVLFLDRSSFFGVFFISMKCYRATYKGLLKWNTIFRWSPLFVNRCDEICVRRLLLKAMFSIIQNSLSSALHNHSPFTTKMDSSALV